MFGNPRLLFFFTLATAIVVGGILVLITKEWWALPIAVGVHFIATAIAVRPIFRAAGSGDKPGPVTEARIEQERLEEKGRDTREPAGEGGERKMAI